MAMTHEEALAVLARERGDKVVITTMTAVDAAPMRGESPVDLERFFALSLELLCVAGL